MSTSAKVRTFCVCGALWATLTGDLNHGIRPSVRKRKDRVNIIKLHIFLCCIYCRLILKPIVDGEASAIYPLGAHCCRGCHESDSWNPQAGQPLTEELDGKYQIGNQRQSFIRRGYLFGRRPFIILAAFLSLYKESNKKRNRTFGVTPVTG